MRNAFLSAVLGIAVVAIVAQPIVVNAQERVGGSTTVRLDKIDNPPNTTIASNATTAQITFTAAPVTDYTIEQLSGNITLYPTNVMPGRTARVFIDTDGSSRTVTVVTNGLPSGTQIHWAYLLVNTNGASSFTVTNQSLLELTVNSKTNRIFGKMFHLRP